MQDVINSDLLKFLQDEEGILRSEMRLDTNVEFGEGWIDRLGSMVSSLRSESKLLNDSTK